MKIQKIISGICLLTLAIAINFTAFCPTSEPLVGGTPYSWSPSAAKDRAIAEYERNQTMNSADELPEYDEAGMVEENQGSREYVGVWCNATKLSSRYGARSQFVIPSINPAGNTTFTRIVGGTMRKGKISGGNPYICRHFFAKPSQGNGWSLEQINGNQFKLMVDTTMFKGVDSDQFVYQEGCHGKAGRVRGKKEGKFMSFTFFACPVHQEESGTELAEAGEFE